ncbi:MAG: alpha amylase C-terminal domain-containing protein, partial [Lachnospiraceae bacterium]|nr:alpha amylase C-terminal domain-containing protein [Lachnospiraceae bacterium]
EHYGYSREWLQGDEWDSVMNYDAFMEPVTWFLTGMQKHSDDYREDLLGNAESFWGAMTHHGTNFTNSSLQVSMNELSNHDHSRFLTRTNKKVGRLHTLGSKAAEEGVNKAVFREAVVMQMTWPGAPTIYYGDEAGVCGFTDPDNRRTYPWGHEDRELIEFHKQMIRVHKLNTVLLTGSLMNLGEDYNYVAYGRFDKEEQIVVVVNNNDHEIEKEVQTWRIGVPKNASMQRIAFTDQNGFSFNTVTIKVEDGKIKVKLPAESACVFKAIFTENGLKRTPVSDENMVDKVYPETVKEADAAKSKGEDKAESKAKKADAAELVKEEKPEKKSVEKAEDSKTEGAKKENAKSEASKDGAKADASKADSAKDGAKADSKADSAKDSVKAEAKSDSSKADGAKGDNAKAEGSKSDNKAEAKSDNKSDGAKAESKAEGSKSDSKADAKQESAKAEAKSESKADAKQDNAKTEAKSDSKSDSAKAEGKADADKKDSKDAAKDKSEKKSDDSKDKAAASDAVKAEPDAKKEKTDNKEKTVKAESEENKQPKKSAWEVAEEVLGKPEDNKKSWFPFFK